MYYNFFYIKKIFLSDRSMILFIISKSLKEKDASKSESIESTGTTFSRNLFIFYRKIGNSTKSFLGIFISAFIL